MVLFRASATRLVCSRPRSTPDPLRAEALTDAFFEAARSGDVQAVSALLAEDAVFVSDGGGKRPAALNPVKGRDQILRMLAGLARKFPLSPTAVWRRARINGQPGFLIEEPEGVTTYALEIAGESVTAIYSVRNPHKLRHLFRTVATSLLRTVPAVPPH